MKTDLTGRIRNTHLPYSKGLLPVLEAVVNSIHAIEEKGKITDDDYIDITVRRLETLPFTDGRKGRPILGDICDIVIQDSGIGFNDENFSAFQTLDTNHKEHLGGRGIGRLMWLKVFDSARITSNYQNGAAKACRKFTFQLPDGVAEGDGDSYEASPDAKIGTTVELSNFHTKYRNASHKQLESIAKDILEHCMWYFIRPDGAPRITLKEELQEKDTDRICLQDFYEQLNTEQPVLQTFKIKDYAFDVELLRLRGSFAGESKIAYCANKRVVKEIPMLPILGNIGGNLKDGNGPFVCHCYVSSKYLDEHVQGDRLAFDFEDDAGTIFEDPELNFRIIENKVKVNIEEYLSEELASIRSEGRRRAQDFVDNKAPRYKRLLNSLPSDYTFPPNATEKDIEAELHKEQYKREAIVLAEGERLLSPPDTMAANEYYAKVSDFLKDLDDAKASDLAAYVHKRHIVLKLLESYLNRNPDGKYEKERVIHQLIFPMQQTSDAIELMDSNLWVIDERLAFHNYLASDRPISTMPITSSISRLEPDLCVLQVPNSDNASALDMSENPMIVSESALSANNVALTIIEFKKPMRNDASDSKNPLEQTYDYFRKIADNKVTTAQGRPIELPNGIRKYAYIICDLTPSMRRAFENYNCTPTQDNAGYYTYNTQLNVQVEIISFNKLVQAAKERNRAFFDRLGLPCF